MRCSYVSLIGRCARDAARKVYVSGVDGSWDVCGQHGRHMIRALTNLYPGRALFTRGRNVK